MDQRSSPNMKQQQDKSYNSISIMMCGTEESQSSTSINSRPTESAKEESTSECLDKSSITNSILQGILRKQTTAIYLIGLLFIIPFAGHVLCRIFPAWVLAHAILLYASFELLDLLENGNISVSKERTRKVKFQKGTKFYRLPRPLSRREKQDFAQRRFEDPLLKPRRTRRTCEQAGPRRQAAAINNDCDDKDETMIIESNENEPEAPDTSSPSKLIGSDSPIRRFRMLASVDKMKQKLSRPEQIEELQGSVNHASPSKLIGGDSPMGRLRMLASASKQSTSPFKAKVIERAEHEDAKKPLRASSDLENSTPISPSKRIGGDPPMGRLRTTSRPLQEINAPQ